MGRQKAAIRINQFVGGFNTESNPLNFPDGASFDESNCDLLNDGSRRRRLGFNTDLGTPLLTGHDYPEGAKFGKNQYLWKNAGGIPTAEFVVVQLGTFIAIHSLDGPIITNNRVYATNIPGTVHTRRFGITSIDGVLVIVAGIGSIYTIEYNGTAFTRSSSRILIRDLFGVASPLATVSTFQNRPTSLTDAHLYNLRNQTFALPRKEGVNGDDFIVDPVSNFQSYADGRYPSNADNVNYALFPNPEFGSDRVSDRFSPKTMRDTPQGTSWAPNGYFIIDALNRGDSRQQAFSELTSRFNVLQWRANVALPLDRTTGGATVVSQYAGRVWYAGFEGSVQGGDERSPKLSSYVLFSQIVKEPPHITRCYQEADPTSNEDADLVDTDGGFMKIDGAYGIKALIPADTSLFVLAENGVWRVSGAEGDSFSATNFSISRVTDKGCVSAGAALYVDGTLFFWSEDAIYSVAQNQVGDWQVQSLTDTTIKTFYQAIPTFAKEESFGYHDSTTGTIRWIYGDDPRTRTFVEELVVNKKFGVFTKNRIDLSAGTLGPVTVGAGALSDSTQEPVTVEGELVTVNGEEVTTFSLTGIRAASQNFYVTLTSTTPVRYVFSGYNNVETTNDWAALTPIDSPAFLTTGFVTGGDGRFIKSIPYITVYQNIMDKASSCYLQTRWDWTTSTSKAWTAPRQIYRDVSVRSGDTMVITKSAIRGMGQSVALNFTSEPDKPFHIFGYEHNLEGATDVA